MRSPFERWTFIRFFIAAATFCAGAAAAGLPHSRAGAQDPVEHCIDESAAGGLDSIRSKADLSRMAADGPPPFRIALNDTFATDAERIDIARWLRIRDSCRRRFALGTMPVSGNALEAASLQQTFVLSNVLQSCVSQLIRALYYQELTYGEFVRKRYEFVRDAADLSTEISAAGQGAEQAPLTRTLQHLLYLRFRWNTDIRLLNVRQPRTVHIRGAIST